MTSKNSYGWVQPMTTSGTGGGGGGRGRNKADNTAYTPGFGGGPPQQPWAGGTLNREQIANQSASATANWDMQNRAWASGQGTPEQQAQGRGWLQQQQGAGQLGAAGAGMVSNAQLRAAGIPSLSREQLSSMSPQEQQARQESIRQATQGILGQQAQQQASMAGMGRQSFSGAGSGIDNFYLGKGPGSNPDGSPGSPSNFMGEDYGTGANDISSFRGMPSQGGYAQGTIDNWASGSGLQTPSNYADEGFRNIAEAYSQYYGIPLGNLQLAQQGQNFNEFANTRDFREQSFLNRAGLDLQKQGNAREDKALQAGIDQFGQNFGLQQELGRGSLKNETTSIANQLALGQGKNSNELLGIQNQFELGKGQNANTAQNNAWNYELGQGSLSNQAQNNAWNYELGKGANANAAQANTNTAQNNQWNYQLGKGQNANTLLGIQNQFELGKGQNANTLLGIQGQNKRYEGQTSNEQYANQTNRQLGEQQNANTLLGIQGQNARYKGQTANEQFANQTALTGVQNQYALGQGQLGFQNRQLDTTNAFNDRQLAQQADLTRENYKNQLTQSRYSAFGRAATPNQRATQSWY